VFKTGYVNVAHTLSNTQISV